MNQETILFYDGPCALCNYAVRAVKKHDTKNRVAVSPIGSQISLQIKEVAEMQEKIDSVILWHNGKIYSRSEVLVQLGEILTGYAKLLHLLKLVPRVLRDKLYTIVAKKRYKWFGRQNYCTTERRTDPQIKIQRIKY